MITKRKQALIWVVFLLLSASPLARITAAQSPAPCVLGYTVGFFNGVWNTELQGIDGRNALQAAFREASGNSNDTYNDEDVGYQLFYNHTGSSVGATPLQDIAEVFEQRANEIDPSGFFSVNGFYLLWESLNGTQNYSSVVSSLVPGLTKTLQQYVNAAILSAAASLSTLLSSPPTSQDYATQDATLSTLAAAGRKLVLVAHSQGNLFVVPAYDYIMPIVGSTRVKVVHIAPASPNIVGPWILSANDLVINALRLDGGPDSVVANNILIPFSSSDPSGHTLVGTYLDPTRNGRAQVELLLTNAFSALPKGSCSVTLSPASSTILSGGTVTLTATTNPAPDDSSLNTWYSWSVNGNAGGLLTTPNSEAATAVTLTPDVIYTASTTAPPGAVDAITVAVYVGPNAAMQMNGEQVGTGGATVSIQTDSGLKNGDFSEGLSYWTQVGNASWSVPTSISYGCSATQAGTQFASGSAYGADGSLEQTFTVPPEAKTLSLYTWNNLDPVVVAVSMIYNGQETVFTPANYEPPSAQALSNPEDYYSVVCTGNPPAFLQYPISQFDGNQVTLRLRATYVGGINGTIGNFSEVMVQ